MIWHKYKLTPLLAGWSGSLLVVHVSVMTLVGPEFVDFFSFNWGQCYKNTTVNYLGNFNPTFSRVKMTFKNDLGLKNITAILG